MPSRVIGIDLGTTNSCVAILDGNDAVVVPNAEGSRTTPSVVGFGESGERFVGQVARRQSITNPQSTVYAIKRLIGRKYADPEVRHAASLSSYTITASKNGDAWVNVHGKDYSPSEISAMILSSMREVAQDFIGEEITDAVITVPAYFNDGQRQATKDAGRIAGLNVLRIINEPTAASLAYGLGSDRNETIAVYDLGGGTFDISILQIGDGLYEVLATNGDTFLGGEDFDNCLIEMLAREFKAAHNIELRDDKMALQRLKEAAERAKHELSAAPQTEIHLPFLTADDAGPKHLQRSITRSEFEALVANLVDRSLEPCRIALRDAGIGVDQIDQVVLVGGMTRMPLVQEKVQAFFNKPLHKGLNPDEVVALGAAIQGAVLHGEIEEVILLDVTPLSLGIETMGGMFQRLIERNTPIPCRAGDIFTTTIDNQEMVSVHVLQGERELATANHSLARFELWGIPPAPRGVPQIEVTFNIDVNGLVSVSACDLATGQEQVVEVFATGGLSEEEMDRMVDEADAHRAADMQRRELVELRNKAKTLLFTSEKSMDEYGEYLPENERYRIVNEFEQARARIDADDTSPEELTQMIATLESSAHRIAEAMYAELMYSSDE